jgi:hypothetical protein
MQFDKQEIIDFLEKEGRSDQAQKALAELPDKIDHEKHAQVLQDRFGIDPGKLVAQEATKLSSGSTTMQPGTGS